MGSVGLFVFALLVWGLLPDHRSWIVLTGASLAWLAGLSAFNTYLAGGGNSMSTAALWSIYQTTIH